MSPVQGADRSVVLDAVRGFAILGILVKLSSSSADPGSGSTPWAGRAGAGRIGPKFLISMFFESKFISTLGFLLRPRVRDAGDPGRGEGSAVGAVAGPEARRPGVIGVLHAVLIWSGDILVTYALLVCC